MKYNKLDIGNGKTTIKNDRLKSMVGIIKKNSRTGKELVLHVLDADSIPVSTDGLPNLIGIKRIDSEALSISWIWYLKQNKQKTNLHISIEGLH